MDTGIRLLTEGTLALVLAAGGMGAARAQENTWYGFHAFQHSGGYDNSAFGEYALFSTNSDNADGNTAIGGFALYSTTRGYINTATGFGALQYNTSGNLNTATGGSALGSNTIGSFNTASGSRALVANTTGSDNNAYGVDALSSNTTGGKNIAVGEGALSHSKTGSNNIGIGNQAGFFFATGANNIEIGNAGLTADNNVIRIGTQGTQKFTAIAGISGVKVTGGAAVFVNARGQLGVVPSSIRYKQDVRPMGNVSDRLMKLRPVIFRYKKKEDDGTKPEQYGLIAEEVAKVMPELVVYNEKGQPETVAYQTLTPLLLNELQREHERMVRTEMQMAQMHAQIDALVKASGVHAHR